jgi:hypothetical protein
MVSSSPEPTGLAATKAAVAAQPPVAPSVPDGPPTLHAISSELGPIVRHPKAPNPPTASGTATIAGGTGPQTRTPRETAQRSSQGGERVVPRIRTPLRRGSRFLVTASAFAAGIAVGYGGILLADSALPLGGYINELPRLPELMANAVRALKGADEVSPSPAVAPSPATPVASVARPSGAADQAVTSGEVAGLVDQLERQLAQGHREQPLGDNALETYRKIGAIAPHAAVTTQLGQRLSASFWTRASQATAARRWDEALHDYQVLNTLPPVPLAAFSDDNDGRAAAGGGYGSSGGEGSTTPKPTESTAVAPKPSIPGEADAPAADSPGAAEPTAARPADASAVAAMSPELPARMEAPAKPIEARPLTSVLAVPAPAGAKSSSVTSPAVVVQPSSVAPPRGAPDSGEEHGGRAPATRSNAAAAAAEPDSPVAAIAMARGEEAIGYGDVISARHFYELAAATGLARAATAVGQTYDPDYLRAKGVRGALADAEAAKHWYQKAIEAGDADARMRLEMLQRETKGSN